jgi:hypothetical protein
MRIDWTSGDPGTLSEMMASVLALCIGNGLL